MTCNLRHSMSPRHSVCVRHRSPTTYYQSIRYICVIPVATQISHHIPSINNVRMSMTHSTFLQSIMHICYVCEREWVCVEESWDLSAYALNQSCTYVCEREWVRVGERMRYTRVYIYVVGDLCHISLSYMSQLSQHIPSINNIHMSHTRRDAGVWQRSPYVKHITYGCMPHIWRYGVATSSRLLKMIGLFCKRAL